MDDYGFAIQVSDEYDEAVIRTRLALKTEGFSILTEMHVGGLLDSAATGRQYLIMGAWNAAVSLRDIGKDLKAAVHLPCNVVVHENDEGAMVAAIDPLDGIDNPDAPKEIALAARDALTRALSKIAAPV